ncbi:hypothetical protein [Terriglobus tenax]|uniref:hypothetical protein n=1 Tax=Terriglobus tenax TaxID=1111115 RepID=UPI0021E07EBA|nr:hypothetical protein [Terriglobus tenax]
MSGPTAFSFTHLFSDLVDRPVNFSEAKALPAVEAKKVFGIYETLPAGRPIIVRADLPFLATIAGLLIGLPAATAMERALCDPMDDAIRDAIYEALNICSTCLCGDERVLLRSMTTHSNAIPHPASELLKKSTYASNFKVVISGKDCGLLSVLGAY